jgi:flavodoxin
MKIYKVFYYSYTGNSEFIAKKIAAELNCATQQIIPAVNSVFILFLLSLLKLGIPVNLRPDNLSEADEVILIGPIWGGQLIAPLRAAIKLCVKASKKIHFAVSCETKDEEKDSKYGYAQVLKKATELGAGYIQHTEAFSSDLANMYGKPWSAKPGEKIKISAENYEGTLRRRVEDFVRNIKSAEKVEREILEKVTADSAAVIQPKKG